MGTAKFDLWFKFEVRGIFSTGAMGALAPANLKNRLLAPAIFGYFSTEGKNLINTQHPQY